MVKEAAAAPLMLTPPLRHWNVGDPVATTVKVVDLPGQAEREEGWVVMVGAAEIVRVAAALVTVPQLLVTTQSYDAASEAATEAMVKEAAVAPLMLTLALRHWKVGEPEAAMLKVVEEPGQAEREVGWVVMVGPPPSARAAAALVTLPQALVTTQSYDAASAAATEAMVKDAAVAPLMLTPALRHWKVGEPGAAKVKVAAVPGQTVWEAGWVVMTGAALTVRVAATLVTLPQKLVATQS